MSFLFISGFVLFLVTLLYFLSFFLSIHSPSFEKLSPYESGFEPFLDARFKFDILYWKIALLYLIFDLELIFLFPFGAIISFFNSFFALLALLFFLVVITLAFFYEYKKGALSL